MDERAQSAGGEALEVRARLAQPPADARDGADREAPADERVEVDPASDDVAARVLRREAELLERLGLDERELVPVRVRLGERAAALVVAVALEPAAGVRRDLGDQLDRALGLGRE